MTARKVTPQKDAPAKKVATKAKKVTGDAQQKGEGEPHKPEKLAASHVPEEGDELEEARMTKDDMKTEMQKKMDKMSAVDLKAAYEAMHGEEDDMEETYMDEEMDETYMDEEMDETMDEMDIDEEMDEITGMDEKDMGEGADLDEEIDLEEILNELELEEGEVEEETVDEAKDMDEETMDEAKDDVEEEKLDEMEVNYSAETANRAGYKADYVHEGDENFDLDALLEEINNLDETEDDVNEQTDSEMDDMYRGSSLHKNKNRKPYSNAPSNREEGQTNEVVGMAAGVAGIVAAAGGLTALEMAADDPEFKAKYPKVAKALEMMQSLGKSAGDTKRMEETAKDEELAETKAALEAVTTELNEVNLLNSKLLYVNRIFKANTLNEAQKLRVVETLDNASNVKEAKLIYETIKDTFTVAKSTKTAPKKSIREGLGMASKAAGTSTAPKKPVLNESNDMVTRMQKLANIKIN